MDVPRRFAMRWHELTRQYTLLSASLVVLVVLTSVTALSLATVSSQRGNILVSLLGSFWGFSLAQGGAVAYERAKQRAELASMFVGAFNEVRMNRGVIAWIKHLLDNDLVEEQIHGLGFAGLDEISVKAVENLVASPLTYRFTSDEFSSERLLRIYQTLIVFRREIPTDRIDGRDKERYRRIKFDRTIASFDVLFAWLNEEAVQVFGKDEWEQRISHTPPDNYAAIDARLLSP